MILFFGHSSVLFECVYVAYGGISRGSAASAARPPEILSDRMVVSYLLAADL
ncbi:MAG: hypothetical protein NXI24_14465 [bacterium]|nr:hypothetical protein [bacterium]